MSATGGIGAKSKPRMCRMLRSIRSSSRKGVHGTNAVMELTSFRRNGCKRFPGTHPCARACACGFCAELLERVDLQVSASSTPRLRESHDAHVRAVCQRMPVKGG